MPEHMVSRSSDIDYLVATLDSYLQARFPAPKHHPKKRTSSRRLAATDDAEEAVEDPSATGRPPVKRKRKLLSLAYRLARARQDREDSADDEAVDEGDNMSVSQSGSSDSELTLDNPSSTAANKRYCTRSSTRHISCNSMVHRYPHPNTPTDDTMAIKDPVLMEFMEYDDFVMDLTELGQFLLLFLCEKIFE
jgi:hypothetical protein